MHLCMQRGRPGAYSLLLEDGKKSPSRGGEECFQQRPGSLCPVPISALGALGPPVPTNPPRLVPWPLGLAVPDSCCFAAPAATGSAGRQAGKV